MNGEKMIARILLIEDDISIGVILNDWLEKHGVRKLMIEQVRSPEEAAGKYDGVAAIILDLTLPPNWPMERTFTLIPDLRKKAPVIVLTGYSEGSEKGDYDFVGRAIGVYGADFCFFKNHLINGGRDWFFRILYAAIERRYYAQREKGMA